MGIAVIVETRESLILRLASADDTDAWHEFVANYEPLLRRFAGKCGLQPADSDEVVQNVMTSVAKSVSTWAPDSERGRFRTWLFRIARNKVIDHLRSRRPDQPTGRSSNAVRLGRLEDSVAGSAELLAEHRREVFRQIAFVVRDETAPDKWDMFWRTTVHGEPVVDVADRYRCSKNTVYIVKCRLVKRMRELYDEWEGQGAL